MKKDKNKDNKDIIDDGLNEDKDGASDGDMEEDVLYVDEIREEDEGDILESSYVDDGGQKRAVRTVVATIITVLLAIGSVCIFLFAYSRGVFTRDTERYDADATVRQEVMENAQRLISNNYEIIMLYYEYGLSHESPNEYGADKNTNAYPVTDSEYQTLASIQELVNSTLVPEEAERVINNAQGMGAIYTEQDGKLVMNIDRFVPLDYDRNWESTRITCDHIEEASARVVVDLSTKEKGVPITVSGSMVRGEDGSWKLKKLIY